MRSIKKAGFTLVEVVIATLLLAVGVAGVFSVTLSARQQDKRHAARDKINQYGRLLQEELKSYVTFEEELTNLQGAPKGSWSHPKDTSQCRQWALSNGCTHDVTALLPPELKSAPFNARLTYDVFVEALGPADNKRNVRRVEITMKWDDP